MKKASRAYSNIKHIGLVDADLLCNGTRHPNLALLKIAGYLKENGYIRKETATEIENEYTYELLMNVILKNYRSWIEYTYHAFFHLH